MKTFKKSNKNLDSMDEEQSTSDVIRKCYKFIVNDDEVIIASYNYEDAVKKINQFKTKVK